MSNISFRCPSCGENSFEFATKPKSYDDLADGFCTNCGNRITHDDINNQAVSIVTDRLKDALKRFR